MYTSSERHSECEWHVDLGANVKDSYWKVRQGWAVKLLVPLYVAKSGTGVVAWISDKARGERGSKGPEKVMDGPKQAKMDCQVVRNDEG